MTNFTQTLAQAPSTAARAARFHRTIGLALGLISGLLWWASASPASDHLAVALSVATGLWWAFGRRLLGASRAQA